MKLSDAIEVLKDYRKGDFVGDDDFCEAIDTVVKELEGRKLTDGCICPACSSDDIYFTSAIHCNHCAMTTEI